MKLVATDQKVTIKWFAVLHDGSKMRNVKGFIHNAWDIQCSCGWESRTGGAIKSCVMDMVEDHKVYDHGYKRDYTEKKSTRLNEQDCQNCDNYLTVMEQVLATKTKKMLCEFCLVVK